MSDFFDMLKIVGIVIIVVVFVWVGGFLRTMFMAWLYDRKKPKIIAPFSTNDHGSDKAA